MHKNKTLPSTVVLALKPIKPLVALLVLAGVYLVIGLPLIGWFQYKFVQAILMGEVQGVGVLSGILAGSSSFDLYT